MKKNLLLLLLIALAAPALHAQNSDNRRSLEVTGGTNHSRFTDEGADCLLGLFFGADLVLCENGPLRFSTGVQYRGSGSTHEFGEDFGEGGSYSFETRESLRYFSIPAEVRYEFDAGKIKPFVRGGGTLGLLLSAKSKTTTNFNGRKNESETDIKDQKKATNLGFSLGGGVSFPLGNIAASSACVISSA